jgi:hypothetical protein
VTIHIFTAPSQPATDWLDEFTGKQMGFEPDKILTPQCCNKERPAKDCVVQAYYDGLSVWCAQGKGCKHPDEIAAKEAKEFANRSAGQKRRREREKNTMSKGE